MAKGKPLRRSKRARRRAEVWLTRLGLAIIPRLPRRVILGLSRVLGALAFRFSKRYRRSGLANLDLVFGDTKSREEKCRLLRASLQTMSLTMLDVLWFTRDSAARMERWFVAGRGLESDVNVRQARVGVTGHFGNWEMLGRFWAHRYESLMSVAMPLKNAAVDALMQRARGITGQVIVPREGALKKLVRHLREGGTVGLLLDQNTAPDDGGVFVDFFGVPATVSPVAGILASMTHAEIIFAYALPRPDGTYVGEMPHRISPEEIARMDRKTAAEVLTRRINPLYEEAILAHPQHWLWSYKRWRYIPEGAGAGHFPPYAYPVCRKK